MDKQPICKFCELSLGSQIKQGLVVLSFSYPFLHEGICKPTKTWIYPHVCAKKSQFRFLTPC